MVGELVDIRLLHDIDDSKQTLVRAKVSHLSKEELDFSKIKQYTFSNQSISDWIFIYCEKR